MKKCMVIFNLISILSLGSANISYAGWYLPIRPGDHVFDPKRYADSVKETAEMLALVQNTIENIHLRLRALLTDTIGIANTQEVLREERTLPLTHEELDHARIIATKTYQEGENPIAAMATQTAMWNKSIANTLNDLQIRRKERQKILETLLHAEDGRLGEQQKENTREILGGQEAIDKVEEISLRLLHTIATEEQEVTLQTLQDQEVAKFYVTPYDPYAPENKKSVEHIGFMKLGQ